ncbi:MAG TPA: MASE1 domain-containing protein, partial [Xanthomonadaceae bacterium]|nr:MASE1 domain-containing protein [Xanthomonadaceae bacterium]
MSSTPAAIGGWPALRVKPAIAVCALIAVCCWVSIHTRLPGGLSTMWIASGVLAGVLLTTARTTWRDVVLAAFAGNLIARAVHGDTWYSVLGLGFASTFDSVLLALVLVHSFGDIADPLKMKRVARVGIPSAVGACALSGLIVASVLAIFGASAFVPTFAQWFPSHTLGMVVFAPLTVIARAQGVRLLGKPGHRIALALSVALTAVTCLLVFSQSSYPLLFLVYLP